MNVEGENILILGGAGMVGAAVCRELLPHGPARLLVAARREFKARRTVEELRRAFPDAAGRIVPVWGDVFLRAEWQGAKSEAGDARGEVLADPLKRRQLIADVAHPLDDAILEASLLAQLVLGTARGLQEGAGADVVIDCMNTATAVGYQDIYSLTQRLASLAAAGSADTDWPEEVERLLAALSIPQLVRHVQILYAAMQRAGTQAYIKVGTSGTGGMGFNIAFTHGEEKPSRLLLSKASLAGAQSLLTFLMARTPDAPLTVREIKPAALIGWHAIGHGPITRRGRAVTLADCAAEEAVSIREEANLVPQGSFGQETGEPLVGVYIDTGENGLYTADEFTAITALGQMEIVTPEEVARNAVAELLGRSTGRDVVAALDGSVMGPSFRGGYLRQAALTRLRQLEEEHGKAVAYEILGPPRLSKLLFEAHLLERRFGGVPAVLDATPEELSNALASLVNEDTALRRRMLSIGVPVLLPDGERLLRGPVIKSQDAQHGWVDLTPANMRTWQGRLANIRRALAGELESDTSSGSERSFAASRQWSRQAGFPDVGEVASWILHYEEGGARDKA